MSDDEEEQSLPTASDNEFYVDKILDHMTYRKAVKKLKPPIPEFDPPCIEEFEHCKYVFHVKWLNFDDSHNTWEVEDNLRGNEQYKKYKEKNGLSKRIERERFWAKDLTGKKNTKQEGVAGDDVTRSSSSASLRESTSTPVEKTSRESSISRNSRNADKKTSKRKSEEKQTVARPKERSSSRDSSPEIVIKKSAKSAATKDIPAVYISHKEKKRMDLEKLKNAEKKEKIRLKQNANLDFLEKQLKWKNKAEKDGRPSRETSKAASPEKLKCKNAASHSKDRSSSSRGSSPGRVSKKQSTSYDDLFGSDDALNVKKKKTEEKSQKKEISFAQREKELDANRARKKASAAAAMYSNTDVFDGGSASSAPQTSSKKRGVQPEPVVESAERLPAKMQPSQIIRKKEVSDEDRARIRELVAARGETREKGKKQEKAEKQIHQLPSVSSLPPIKKKTHPAASATQAPAKPIPKVPPLIISKASKFPLSSVNLMDSILSGMDQTSLQPSALPSSTGPQSVEFVVQSRSDLMLKSWRKNKAPSKVPTFHSRPKDRARSSVSATSEPMEVDYSPLEDHVVVDVSSEQTVASQPLPKTAAAIPETVPEAVVEEQEEPIRLFRELRTKVYPLNRIALLKKLGILGKRSKTTDALYDSWRKEGRVWQSFDQMTIAMYNYIRAEASEVVDMHLSKNNLRVTMTWDQSTYSWKLPSGDAAEKAARCLQKNDLPVELKHPLPDDLEVKFGEKLVFHDVTNAKLNNNNAKEDYVEQEKVDRSEVDKEQKPPSLIDILGRRMMLEHNMGMPMVPILSQVVQAYQRLDHIQMEKALSGCSSAIWRLRFIKEVLLSVPPKDCEEPSHWWIVEADGCHGSSYSTSFDNCRGGKHGKCKILKVLLNLLPEQFRFHSKSPFRPEVFMHCFKYGAHCQKALFIDAGVPFCIAPSEEYHSEDTYTIFDHFGVLLCQGKPCYVVEMLKKGVCVNSLAMLKVPTPMSIKPFSFEAIQVEEFLENMSKTEISQFSDEKWTFNLVQGLKAVDNRLKSYVGGRLGRLREELFPAFGRQDLLTPVHTIRSVGPSHTANIYTHLAADEGWNVFDAEDYSFQPLTKDLVAKVQKGEALIMISVFRIQFRGGVEQSKEETIIRPLTPVSSDQECAPLSLRLVDPDGGTPRPCITLSSPMTTSKNDEWVFKIDSSNSGKLGQLTGARLRMSLDTAGAMGIKFLLQLILLSN